MKQNYFIEEMLKNKHNTLFDQLVPLDISGPVFDVLKQLYTNYTDRIDKLPKHLVNILSKNYKISHTILFQFLTCDLVFI